MPSLPNRIFQLPTSTRAAKNVQRRFKFAAAIRPGLLRSVQKIGTFFLREFLCKPESSPCPKQAVKSCPKSEFFRFAVGFFLGLEGRFFHVERGMCWYLPGGEGRVGGVGRKSEFCLRQKKSVCVHVLFVGGKLLKNVFIWSPAATRLRHQQSFVDKFEQSDDLRHFQRNCAPQIHPAKGV